MAQIESLPADNPIVCAGRGVIVSAEATDWPTVMTTATERSKHLADAKSMCKAYGVLNAEKLSQHVTDVVLHEGNLHFDGFS